MRFLPLLPSDLEAAPWLAFKDVELLWTGRLGRGWSEAARGGLAVHALHLRRQPWKDALLEDALAALQPRLEPDFLVLPAARPSTRWGAARLLGILESLLEAATPLGVRITLRPEPGATGPLLELLRGAQGDAVGFCWDAAMGTDLEQVADRLHCAVGSADVDPGPLQHWGYRWNMAIPGEEPGPMAELLDRLHAAHGEVLFPAEMPTTALGRPVVPDPEVSLGRIWDRGEPS